ncbi:MAG TPA: hypothetical protein VGH58_03325 [Solirubrobacterales bacterium]|jgi:hypothetical protein
MNAITKKIAIALLALGALLVPASQASAAGTPAWRFDITPLPTNLEPGAELNANSKLPMYFMVATNVGTAPTSGPVTLTETLPAGLTPEYVRPVDPAGASSCNGATATVICVYSGQIQPGQAIRLERGFDVDGTGTILSEGDSVFDEAVLTGGGAVAAVARSATKVSSTPAPFGFVPGIAGLGMTPYGGDGTAQTSSGAHPHVMTVNLNFTNEQLHSERGPPIGTDGGAREVHAELPKGMIVNPTATPQLCDEASLEGLACPAASQVGLVNVLFAIGSPVLGTQPLYNQVAAPGKGATFGFDLLGYIVHIEGKVGLEAGSGNYTEVSETGGIPDLYEKPTLGVQPLFWGDPSSSAFDYVRQSFNTGCGFRFTGKPCSVTPQDTPFLTMPTSCEEAPGIGAEAASYGHPEDWVSREDVLRDPNGNEIGTSGCGSLEFNPSFKARPTTTVADSPSGLEFDLEVPQTDSLSERATANLRKAVVSLPEGMSLNPASANGLGSCSSAQVGIDPATAVPNGDPVACPESSRIGSIEVNSALADHPILGSVYVATPYDNPFDSLLAIYAVLDDPRTGTLVKLPGHVVPNPSSGQLVTTFDNNPQLPFSHFKLSFFGGAHGVLRTPAVCGSYSTTSSLTPWSAPESGPPATPKDEYSIATPPSGGSCAADLPNSPSLDAGVISPIAHSYTPFVLHLRRSDGTQQISSFTTKLPPGLTARLAGTAECSDAALSAAEAKTGAAEQASPSCPASSHVGSVVAGAGAGPSPYYAHGEAYLSGPYKGAPLSIAVITPAVAGPYDLGTIVTRAALRLDPSSGQATATTDPLPSILDGIPLDVRTIDVKLDRPRFTLTGTSCDPSSIEGSATSTLGQVAPLTSRFQLGECAGLAFKPKLGIRLFGPTTRGGHPALRGTVAMPEGGANVATASVALPHSEFLDQAHIGTVCTRVQFAEGDGNGSNCPPGSIYGTAVASSPLVDYALEGNAILRSSSHELPDLVIALHGPPYQPVAVDVVGRIDSVKGGIRTTFEGVPDLPVSSFVLSMQGGAKGLLQNSTNICKKANKATALFAAQNGKGVELTPALKNGKCGKQKKHKHSHHRRAAR